VSSPYRTPPAAEQVFVARLFDDPALRDRAAELLAELIREVRQDTIREIRDAWCDHE
jgi:hypothetical protein